jgi:hypothetical protein
MLIIKIKEWANPLAKDCQNYKVLNKEFNYPYLYKWVRVKNYLALYSLSKIAKITIGKEVNKIL